MIAFWVVFLFVAAAALIILEFVLPGGILGAIGAILMVTSCVMGMINFPQYAVFILIAESIGALGTIGIGMYLLANTSAGGLLTLRESLSNEEGWESSHTDAGLVGKVGIVKSALRPAGIVEIDDRRYDVTSDGIIVDAGEQVKVVKVSGNYIVVEPAETTAASE